MLLNRLKNYLSAITKYFSTYEDSDEIIADIESRIAEIFLSKLNEDKQVIMVSDVAALKATMGTIADFEQVNYSATIEPEEFNIEEEPIEDTAYEPKPPKKLYRDENRKLIGGVAAGVAHYFQIDPLWVRLIFLLSFFDLFSFFTITGIVLASYLLLWAIIPGSVELAENKKVRHLFRNSEEKVLGGVASGLASYFGIDVTIARVIFVATMFTGGIGLVIYLIIWIITPEAKSLTERMKMEGEPITLENIEKKIRDSLNLKEGEEENGLAKILLFPFRLVAQILDGFNTDLRPLAKFVGKLALWVVGGALALSSAVATFGLLIVIGVIVGAVSNPEAVNLDDIPLYLIQDTVPLASVFFTFITVWIPIIFVGIVGVSIIARQPITKPAINWSLLGIWIIGIIGTSATVPVLAANFHAEGIKKINASYQMPKDKVLRLFAKETHSMNFNDVTITIYGHENSEATLVQKFKSKGSSRQNAIENTHTTHYAFTHRDDSTFIFPTSFTLAADAPFRNQSLHLELFLPYNQPFRMDESMLKILLKTIYRNGYTEKDVKIDNLWKFDGEKLKCVSCNPEFSDHTYKSEDGETIKEVDVAERIEHIILNGNVKVHILQGDESSIKMIGSEFALEETSISLGKGALEVKANTSQEIKIHIYTPSLKTLSAKGKAEVFLKTSSEGSLNIGLSDHAHCEAVLEINNLNVDTNDVSKLTLSGKGNNCNVRASDASKIVSTDFSVENLNVDAKDGASIDAFAIESANILSRDGAKVNVKRPEAQ